MRPRPFLLLAGGSAWLAAGCAAPRVSPVEFLPGPPTVVLARLPEEFWPPDGPLDPALGERWLRLVLVDERARKLGPPILADYSVRGGVLRLAPRYGLSPGQLYRAILDLPGRDPATSDHRVPSRPTSRPARVESIYPSGDRLPANLLKFYVHFSKPMREGEYVFDHLRLLDDGGRPVHDPWRRVDLWTPDAKRLTLWIHPGRVKRGVNLREQLGPVLEAGRSYALEIGAGVLDAEGRPLGRAVVKRFTAVEDDRSCPAAAEWKLDVPRPGTRGPLVATLPEPLDRWLLVRYVTVRGPSGEDVPGEVSVGPEERSWSFTPSTPWRGGGHTLVLGERLEDLAGNTPLRPFEEDLAAPPRSRERTRTFVVEAD